MANSVNLDTSEVLNIICKKGDTFSITLTLKNSAGTALTLSTSNYEFLMQVKSETLSRRGKSSSSLVLSTPNSAVKNQKRVGKGPSVRPQNITGELNFEAPTVDDSGNVTIEASADTMSQISSGKYSYDIQYILPSSTGLDTHKTILRGKFIVNADITEAFETTSRR
tara:strand:+ start:987 stop:1487 length:501 start_codon:yes stop_codon:yes gene_type:complete